MIGAAALAVTFLTDTLDEAARRFFENDLSFKYQ
jgi:hypothetical protein